MRTGFNFGGMRCALQAAQTKRIEGEMTAMAYGFLSNEGETCPVPETFGKQTSAAYRQL